MRCRQSISVLAACCTGSYAVTITSANGTTIIATQLLLFACARATFGGVGETCLNCPFGASCAGYSDRTLNHTYPVALHGFFNLNADMRMACPPSVASAFPGRDVCIVTCEPDACVGSNKCAEGYESRPPSWVCAAPAAATAPGAAVIGGAVGGGVVLLLVVVVVVVMIRRRRRRRRPLARVPSLSNAAETLPGAAGNPQRPPPAHSQQSELLAKTNPLGVTVGM